MVLAVRGGDRGRWSVDSPLMWHLFAVVLPLGLSAAVSPVMFTQQVFLVGGPDGRRSANLFLAGAGVVVLAVAGAVWFAGGAVNLPAVPRLDAAADVFLGVLLLALSGAVALRRTRAPEAEAGPVKAMPASAAFGFGVFSMATNVTTLAIVIAAAKEVAASGQGVSTRVGSLVVLLFLACLPAWSPVVLAALPRGIELLNGVRERGGRYTRQALVVVLLAVGAFFAVRGVLRLSGL